jgi:hypothetical protein
MENMTQLNKHECGVIALFTKYNDLSVRRIHVLSQTCDSLIMAKTVINNLISRDILRMNEHEIVNLTPRFEGVVRTAYAQSGRNFSSRKNTLHQIEMEEQEPSSKSKKITLKTDKPTNGTAVRTNAKALPTNKAPLNVPQEKVVISIEDMVKPINKLAIYSNISQLSRKLSQEIARPVIKEKNKRMEDLLYLSNIMPGSVSVVLREIAMDIQQAS